jgi:hypothetical protein
MIDDIETESAEFKDNGIEEMNPVVLSAGYI